jgi:drug/metabolite transporter (DMT)-like permease
LVSNTKNLSDDTSKAISQPLVAWLILIGLVLTWGSSFILIKRGLEHFSATEVGAVRVVITFLFLLNSLTPLFTLIVGLVIFKIKAGKMQVIGVFVGLLGALGLVSSSGGNTFSFNITYALMVVLATIFYAINVNLIKAKLNHIKSITITSVTFFIVGFPASIILFGTTDFVHKLTNEPGAWAGLGYLAILAVVGTGVAMMGFNVLIKKTTPIFASSVTYLIPVVALLWGIIDGEYFDPSFFLWIGLIIGGVLLVNKTGAKPRRIRRKRMV